MGVEVGAQAAPRSHRSRSRPRALIDSSRGWSPFLFQLPFVSLIVLIVCGIAIFDPATLGEPGIFGCLAVVGIATTAALVVPWSRLPNWAVGIIPVLDICSVPFLRDALHEIRVSDLVLIPVVWLSAQFLFRGMVISSLAATAASFGRLVLDPDAVAEPWRQGLLPALIVVVGIAVAQISRRGGATQAMLEQQSALTEKALERASRQQRVLDGLLNAMSIGVVGLDREGNPLIVNRSHQRLLGRDFGGRMPTLADIDIPLYETDRTTPLSTRQNPLERARRGETFDNLLVWGDSMDNPGEKTALTVSARQIKDDLGVRAGAVLVFHDVTQEVDALQAREELVASVSHELRTPLTSIIGYLELLEDDDELAMSTRHLLSVVSSNADRLLKIVSDLLIAAKDGDVELSILPTMIDLVPLVQDSIRLIEPRALDADISVVATMPTTMPAFGDASRLRQVIDNVLSNAVKYGRLGGHVWVTLSDDDGLEAKLNVTLRIVDDGIGISADGQSKLFTRFYRDDSARRSTVHGAGLGLHISRAIVRQHGGDIRVTSRPEAGTTVTIELPSYVELTDPALHSSVDA